MNKFRYVSVISGEVKRFEHENREILVEAVTSFYRKNNIIFNLEDINRRIDRQSKTYITQAKTKKISFSEALNGAKALLKYSAGNSVSGKEILRRSSICEKCPLLSNVSNCMGCGAASVITKAVNGIRSVKGAEIPIPKAVNTKYCGVCQCSIPLMVVTRYEDFRTETTEKNSRRPDNCWLKTTSPNFTDE